ncbi:MAG: F0F1 ATP synthase subunit A [Acidobacteriota bacterium]
MEHHYSILFGPVNHLLVRLFGHAPARYQELMGTHDGYWLPDHVVMAMLVVVVVALALIPLRRKMSVEAPGKFQQILELTLSGLRDLIEEVVGHGFGARFLPFVLGLAVFIFVGNIFGLFYFLQPPTGNPSTTFALSITAFLYYNMVGIRDNGLFKYLAHFAGPLPILAPLMVPIEIISHLARILSLALRLFGNIFGEHTATGIFFAMFPFVIPWPMMGLGIFGALLQAFIFIMLTMAYLQGAVASEEH